jgi:hypothetical protein
VVVVLSTAVGTTLFATISESPSQSLRIWAGLLSFLATAAAGVQTLVGWDKRSQAHSAASHAYGRIRREVEEWEVQADEGETPKPQLLHEWEMAWNEVEAAAPAIPQRIFDDVNQEVPKTQD